jgi:hypothetical protein
VGFRESDALDFSDEFALWGWKDVVEPQRERDKIMIAP